MPSSYISGTCRVFSFSPEMHRPLADEDETHVSFV